MTSIELTERLLFCRNFELSDGTELTFAQSSLGDVGCVVWDAALVLCSYIDLKKHEMCWEGKYILELGSGTGAVGLTAACLGSRAVITDLVELLPLMSHNIALNNERLKGSCKAAVVSWGNQQQMSNVKETHFPTGVDFILLADCVYYEESVESLVSTILHFAKAETTVLCSYEERETKAELQCKFLKMLGEYFDITEIPPSSQDPHYSCADIHVMEMVLKTNPNHL